jgi:hypothetical protein
MLLVTVFQKYRLLSDFTMPSVFQFRASSKKCVGNCPMALPLATLLSITVNYRYDNQFNEDCYYNLQQNLSIVSTIGKSVHKLIEIF